MQGFKGIIIDLFGFSQVTMSDIFIEDSFFPEGFL